MKYLQIVVLFFCIFAVVNTSSGELFQLVNVNSVVEKDVIKQCSAEELLEKEKGKAFVIEFLKMSLEDKFKMTTSNYKDVFKRPEKLKKIFDKESYEKVDFKKIELFDKGKGLSMTIKTDVYWFNEGYDGASTVYFMLKKTGNKWLLDWLVF